MEIWYEGEGFKQNPSSGLAKIEDGFCGKREKEDDIWERTEEWA